MSEFLTQNQQPDQFNSSKNGSVWFVKCFNQLFFKDLYDSNHWFFYKSVYGQSLATKLLTAGTKDKNRSAQK